MTQQAPLTHRGTASVLNEGECENGSVEKESIVVRFFLYDFFLSSELSVIELQQLVLPNSESWHYEQHSLEYLFYTQLGLLPSSGLWLGNHTILVQRTTDPKQVHFTLSLCVCVYVCVCVCSLCVCVCVCSFVCVCVCVVCNPVPMPVSLTLSSPLAPVAPFLSPFSSGYAFLYAILDSLDW